MSPLVVRVYHAGRDPAHRRREAALLRAGARIVLVVPSIWPEPGSEDVIAAEPGIEIVSMPVARAGDINRHRFADPQALRTLLDRIRPDILDVHEEPVSLVARQWQHAAPAELRVVLYTAQNVDKRYPPPFAQFERHAYARASGVYPCSAQAASVVWGKGFRGIVEVLPLGVDTTQFHPGGQRLAGELRLLLAGRMVPEKGVRDAVATLVEIRRHRPARLVLVGTGPEIEPAVDLARQAGVADAVEVRPWMGTAELASELRRAHVVLVPSRATTTWVEQFGRIAAEAQACGAVVAGYASGALPEAVGDAGVLVDEGDMDALAGRVRDLLLDPRDWERRRHAGLTLTETRSWPVVAQRQVEFYSRVLDGPVRYPVAPADELSRQEARARFGPTAPLAGSARPFADPLLRQGGPAARFAARLVDTATNVAGLLSQSRRRSRT